MTEIHAYEGMPVLLCDPHSFKGKRRGIVGHVHHGQGRVDLMDVSWKDGETPFKESQLMRLPLHAFSAQGRPEALEPGVQTWCEVTPDMSAGGSGGDASMAVMDLTSKLAGVQQQLQKLNEERMTRDEVESICNAAVTTCEEVKNRTAEYINNVNARLAQWQATIEAAETALKVLDGIPPGKLQRTIDLVQEQSTRLGGIVKARNQDSADLKDLKATVAELTEAATA